MLDTAADLLGKYWNCCTFDGHPIVPITVPSDEDKTYDEHDDILRLIGAPMKELESDKKLQSFRKKFKFIAMHAVRRQNEFAIMKCQFFKQPGLECNFCKQNPPKCTQTLNLLKKYKGRLMQPIPSTTHTGHFLTFLEMIKMDSFPEEEARGDLGKRMVCPNWGFTSVTEQDRHRKLFHPKTKACDIVPEKSQIHKCNFKINGKVCGETFQTHMLWKHKNNVGHKKNRKEAAKEQAEKDDDKLSKRNTEKSFALKVTKQRTITSCLNREDQPDEEGDEVVHREEGDNREEVDDEEEEVDDEEEEVNDKEEEVDDEEEEGDNDEEERDDEGCNARPCIIDEIVSTPGDVVEWVQCELCPKWFHQYCVGDEHRFRCSFQTFSTNS